MSTFLFSSAKINRTLHIQKFSHTYQKHELISIMQKISLCDTLYIEELENLSGFSGTEIVVKGKFQEGVPSDDTNIITQAILFFYKKYKISKNQQTGFKIILEKNIPNQAGLGGGSSNAAEMIKFLHKKYALPLFSSEYIDLGSDVPFFLEDFSTGLLTGIGEKIEKYPDNDENSNQDEKREYEKNLHGILIFPHAIKISTKWAFQNFTKQKSSFKNDFTPFLQEKIPEISQILSDIQKISQKIPILQYEVSGSGSSIFILFSEHRHREKFLTQAENFSSVPHDIQTFFCTP